MTTAGFIAIAITLLLTGCGPGGTKGQATKITNENVAKIVRDTTTARQIIDLFGEPAKTLTTSTGGKQMVFSDSNTPPHTLYVIVSDGVVVDYAFNPTNP